MVASGGACGVPAVDAIYARSSWHFVGNQFFGFNSPSRTNHPTCPTAHRISAVRGSTDGGIPLNLNPIEEEEARETRGGEAATDRALRTKDVRAQETSPDQTIADPIVLEAHALIGDGRTESVRPAAADRHPAAALETIAEFQSVITAPLALRRQNTTRETAAGTPIIAPSDGTRLLPRAAARPLRPQPGSARRPRSPRNKPPLTKTRPPTTAPS